MLHHSFGGQVIVLSLQHFIAPAVDLMFCLQALNGRVLSVGALTLGLTTYLQGFVINGTWYLLQQRMPAILGGYLDQRPTGTGLLWEM